MTTRAPRRRRRVLAALAATAVLAVGTVVALRSQSATPPEAGCLATVDGTSFPLDLSQAANAATIAAVAIRLGLSDHAVSVGLATAMQESKLHNLDYGDRDSVGLFQQRPSQGWGSRSQILDPHYAATAFFTHLVRVPGWETMSVAVAAQAVQRSASGAAYADWEPTARALARSLTGQVPHGIACTFTKPASSPQGLTTALAHDLGPTSVGVPVPAKRGWRTASWLVAQAAQYDIDSVTFNGLRWTRSSGRWGSHPSGSAVAYTVARQQGA